MGFEIIGRGQWGGVASALVEGQVRVGKAGRLLVHAADLRMVGITDRVVVMVDQASLRIALRPPRDGEHEKAMLVSVVKAHKGHDGGRRAINAKRAFDRLGLETAKVGGAFDLTTKDDLLLINLIGVGKGAGKKT